MGALLLLLPPSHKGPLSPLDAWFTSTSALCVTGLIVKDTGAFWTPFGQAVILALIQLGGLSYMTFASLFLFLIGKKGSLTFRLAAAASFPALGLGELRPFFRRIVLYSLGFEALGAFLLGLRFVPRFGLGGLWHALFNSVSAFCNAGFSTFSTSLVPWRADPVVNLTVMSLVVLGGLGFMVLWELEEMLRGRKRRFSMHTRAVLGSTAFLLLSAALVFLAVESLWGVMRGMGLFERLWASAFMAVTPRTAGFNTVDYGAITPFSKLFTMLLMFVGGSPGGTAGGLKTTTFVVLWLWLLAKLRRRQHPEGFGYSLPPNAFENAVLALLLGLGAITLSALFLSLTDSAGIARRGFLPYAFEVFSAFGTVGLSTGCRLYENVSLSADLSALGKLVIIFTMLLGRIGVLSVFMALLRRREPAPRRVRGRIIVG